MLELRSIIDEAQQYLKGIPSSVKVEGVDRILKKIQKTRSTEQQKDCLASFILAMLLAPCAKRLVFEETCRQHQSGGQHDLVIYLMDDTRVVNEIKRLKPTAWDQKETEIIRNTSTPKVKFYKLKDDPNRSTTGFLDTILKEVELKSKQIDPNNTNIVWFSSCGTNHYEADDIGCAAHHYAVGQPKLPPDQPGHSHKKPEWLTALGWFWDGDLQCTTLRPECFFLEASPVAMILGKTIIKVKEYKESQIISCNY